MAIGLQDGAMCHGQVEVTEELGLVKKGHPYAQGTQADSCLWSSWAYKGDLGLAQTDRQSPIKIPNQDTNFTCSLSQRDSSNIENYS